MDHITEKRADRLRFLNALYEAARVSPDATVSMWAVGGGAGLDRETIPSVVDYLTREGLVEHVAVFADRGEINITHNGAREVERAVSEPDKPTSHFPPIRDLVIIGSMTNSQVQHGSHGSQQSLTIAPNDLTAVREFVREFAGKLDQLGLTSAGGHEARAEIASIEAQLSSPKPKTTIIAEGLRSMRTILEGAAGNALASDLLPQLAPLLALLAGTHHPT